MQQNPSTRQYFGVFLDARPRPKHPFIHRLSGRGCCAPLLDKLIASGDLSPTSGIKIANVKQYNFHIRAIVLALEQDDREAFNKAVSLLQNESMLFCD